MIDEADWLGVPTGAPKPSTGGRPAIDHRGRQRKLLCGSCGFIAYATAGAVERAGGLPSCACGSPLEVPNLRDRAVIEWDELEAELQAAGPRAWNDAMRKLGAVDLVVTLDGDRLAADRRAGAAPSTCQWDAGYCNVIVSGKFCREHDPAERAAERRAGGRGA